MAITVTNAGPDADTLHVQPTAWFRNTWARDPDASRPSMAAGDTDGSAPEVLFRANETNTSRLFGAEPITPYPKDGINDTSSTTRLRSIPAGPAPSAQCGTG
jgi:hypothetical protein